MVQSDQSQLNEEFQRVKEIYDSGEYPEAKLQFRSLARKQKAVLGYQHGDTLLSRHYVALSMFELDEYVEAELEWRISVCTHEASLGKLHEDTLDQRHWLASAIHKQKRYSEADAEFKQTMLGRETTLGKNDEDALFSRYCLGLTYYRQGKFADAEKYLRGALDGQEKTLEANHEDALESRYWLALACDRQKKFADAKEHFRRVLRGQEETLGKDDEDTCRTRRKLEKVVRAQQEDPEKEKPVGTSKDVDSSEGGLPDASSGHDHDADESSPSRIDQFFQSRKPLNQPYMDSEIMEISTLLKQVHPSWSKVPRTYITVRSIGSLSCLDDIITCGFSDYSLPANERSLPSCLVGSSRSKFVAMQDLVLTQSQMLSLSLDGTERGRHCYFKQDEPLPFKAQQKLGDGGCSQVDKVVCLTSSKEYARKLVHRSVDSQGKAASYMRSLIKEIEILKQLHHRHIVRFVGSYSDPINVALLMSPVAEMDLSMYLDSANSTKHGELRTFFGCLARALEFLHQQRIRHKDIKPHNILVNQGNILFTDFGLSRDFSNADGSTTFGVVDMRTVRYCAPEAYLQEARNKSSDIWSLGVVFLEMVVVLKGKSMKWMRQFFRAHGSQFEAVHANPKALEKIVEVLGTLGRVGDNEILGWINQMLEQKPKSRSTAWELVESIISAGHQGDLIFCGLCCSMPEEDWDMDGNESPATTEPRDSVESMDTSAG